MNERHRYTTSSLHFTIKYLSSFKLHIITNPFKFCLESCIIKVINNYLRPDLPKLNFMLKLPVEPDFFKKL